MVRTVLKFKSEMVSLDKVRTDRSELSLVCLDIEFEDWKGEIADSGLTNDKEFKKHEDLKRRRSVELFWAFSLNKKKVEVATQGGISIGLQLRLVDLNCFWF